jgi:hypothetical protein
MRDCLYTPCHFCRISRIESNPSRRGSREKSVLAIAPWFLLVAFTQVPAQNPPSDPTLANPVYQKRCAKCHGKTAEGRHFGGPSLISDKSSFDDLREILGADKWQVNSGV